MPRSMTLLVAFFAAVLALCAAAPTASAQTLVLEEPVSYEVAVQMSATAIGEIDKLRDAKKRQGETNEQFKLRLDKLRKDVDKALEDADKALRTAGGNAMSIKILQDNLAAHLIEYQLLSAKVDALEGTQIKHGVRLSDLELEVAQLQVDRTAQAESRDFFGGGLGGGFDAGPMITGVVGPVNGMGHAMVEYGHQDVDKEYFINGELAMHAPNGNMFGLGGGILWRVHPNVALGPNLGFVQYSYRVGGNSYEDGLGANKRMGKFQGLSGGLAARFGFTPPDASTEFGALVRVNGRVGELWHVYRFEEKKMVAGFAPAAGLYFRTKFGPAIRR